MRTALKPIVVIFVSLALSIAGSSMLGTLLALRMSVEGFAHGIIGPILAFHSVGFVLGTLYCVRIIRRVGHIRSFAAFSAIACVATLLHPFYIEGVAWAGLRTVTGFCSAGLMMVMESWINDRTSNAMRGSIMAVYMGTNYMAQGGGQFALSLGSATSNTLFMIAAALTAAALVPLALTRSKAPAIEEHERMGLGKLYGVAPVALVSAFLAGAAMSGFMAVLPVYAQEVGYGINRISLLMGTVVLFGMALQFPIGRLSDRIDRRLVILMLGLLALSTCIPIVRFGDQIFPILLVAGGLFVGLAGSIYPMCVALTNDSLHQHQMVSASGTLLLIFGIGTIVGPTAGSGVMSLMGPDGLFYFAGTAMALLAIFGIIHQLTGRRVVSVEEQAEYVPMASTSTPLIYEIDPRNEEFHPHVIIPEKERRQRRGDRRGGPSQGGRRREDAADFNE